MTVNANWYGDKGAAKRGAIQGLFNAAQHLKEQSTAIAPIEEATLIKSATVSVEEATPKAAVSYDTVYAARQHEELTWRHDPGRQAKYLEQPLHDDAATLQALIAAGVRRGLGQ